MPPIKRRANRYDRKALLKILEEKCPEALSKLPHKSTFEFETLHEEPNQVILRIGDLDRKSLWVFMEGECKPWLTYCHYNPDGAKTPKWRDCPKEAALDDIFASLGTQSNELKALVLFLYVWCGKKDLFADFDFGRGLPILVQTLMKITDTLPAGSEEEPERPIPRSEKYSEEKGRTFTFSAKQVKIMREHKELLESILSEIDN